MSEFTNSPSARDASEQTVEMRIRASYHSLPAAPAEQVARCRSAVLAAANSNQHKRPVVLTHPRWWWGAAAAAALVITVVQPWRPTVARQHADSTFATAVGSGLPVGSTLEDADGKVQFSINLPTSAKAVSVVGDFNGWDDKSTPMTQREQDGTWSVRVPLEPGRYTYAFVVDGHEWLVDALAPQVPDVGFGPANAVIVDGAP